MRSRSPSVSSHSNTRCPPELPQVPNDLHTLIQKSAKARSDLDNSIRTAIREATGIKEKEIQRMVQSVEIGTAHMEETEIVDQAEMRRVHTVGKIEVRDHAIHNDAHHHVDRDHATGHKIVGRVLIVDHQGPTEHQRRLPRSLRRIARRESRRR